MGTEWYVIGRGFAGWHATGKNVRSSGGSLHPYKYWTGAECKGYAQEAVEGALVYDAAHLEGTPAFDDFVKAVISGPMVDPCLPPHGIDRFVIHEDKPYGALDRVGVGIHEELLRKVPGIKLGHVRNGEVVWE